MILKLLMIVLSNTKNFNFRIKLDGHVMFKIYEESGYSLDLTMLTILY